MQQNKRPTRASELRIEEWTVPVGLAVRIFSFHPQGPSSTPVVLKVLDRSSVSRYIELGFADFTRKTPPSSPGFNSRTGKHFGGEQCLLMK